YKKFIRIFPSCFAIKARAPLPELFLKAFARGLSKLLDGLECHLLEGRFCEFSNAWNAPYRKRRQKTRFYSGPHPQNAVRLGFIGCHFSDQASACKPSGTGKPRFVSDFTEDGMRRGQRRSEQTLRAGQIEICFVDRCHFHHGGKVR